MYGMKSGAKQLLVIGVDEVGRGPIAGPVAVGAFVILNPDEVKRLRIFRGVKESKQLSAAKREEWFGKILEAQEKGLVDYAVTFQSEKVIDKKGISFAIRTALAGSLGKLRDGDGKRRMPIDPGRALVLLDGGLKAPAEYVHQKTIIRGRCKRNGDRARVHLRKSLARSPHDPIGKNPLWLRF